MITDYPLATLDRIVLREKRVVLHHRYPCPGPLFTPRILSPGVIWGWGVGYRSVSC